MAVGHVELMHKCFKTMIQKLSLVNFVFNRRSFGQSKDHFALRKKQLQFNMAIGSVKCGTHPRVCSQTLAHGNNKNEIRQINKKRM